MYESFLMKMPFHFRANTVCTHCFSFLAQCGIACGAVFLVSDASSVCTMFFFVWRAFMTLFPQFPAFLINRRQTLFVRKRAAICVDSHHFPPKMRMDRCASNTSTATPYGSTVCAGMDLSVPQPLCARQSHSRLFTPQQSVPQPYGTSIAMSVSSKMAASFALMEHGSLS